MYSKWCLFYVLLLRASLAWALAGCHLLLLDCLSASAKTKWCTIGGILTLTFSSKELDELSKKFAREQIIPIAKDYDKSGDFPWEIIKSAQYVAVTDCVLRNTCSAMGFVNMHIPERYGGLGFGSVDACIAGLPALNIEFSH